ncbi:HNH endonuclease [Ferruginibacter albus]|uniref:HNH endonuclease n=1 Tax=Ferruginibacter albus TaxID=2875540 RepID=UPI001CC3EAFB|nr:HNH endonuclease [Ferruginibacter albus]UAY52705.1 HNH endonuclease [Ferruginibacter albus]
MAQQFEGDIIDQVWEKGQVVEGYDSSKFRKDLCGAWMVKDSYNNQSSSFGWVIDHSMPISKGGTDELANLQPLQWQNNLNKGDSYPEWLCVITSVENRNEPVISRQPNNS